MFLVQSPSSVITLRNSMTESENLNSAAQAFLQCYLSVGTDERFNLPKSPFVGNSDLLSYLNDDFVNQEVINVHGFQECQIHFDNFMKHLCRPPLFTCIRVNTLKISPSEAEQMLSEYLNDSMKHSKFTVRQHPIISDALLIHSSTSSHCIEPCDNEVIVDLACGIAVLRGSHIYAPGVMSMHPGIENGSQVSVLIDVEGKCLRGAVKTFEGKKLFIGNGKCKISRKELFTTTSLKGVAVVMTDTVFNSPSLGNVFPELMFLQNLPSVVCSHVLDPQPGDWVLDMCAAPGGKTTHLAALMKNQGKVIAIDKTKAKVEKIEESANRWGTNCVEVFNFDSTKICDQTLVADEMFNAEAPGPPPYRPGIFDRILLDTPCSALGQRPQLYNKMTVSQLKSYKFLQRKLFARAVELLKPGGTLVYSTCSLTLEENEGLVFWAINTFPCLQLSQQTPHIGTYGRLGAGLADDQLLTLQRFGFCGCLDSKKENHAAICADICDSIGFFIAKFIKHKKCLA